MSTVRTSAFFLTIAALAAVAPDATAQERGAVSGCYVPPTGLVYVVGAPGAPDDCLDQRHVSFTWPDVAQVATKPGNGNGPPGGSGGGAGAGPGGQGGAPTVPSGAVMHFDLAACPSGWTEMEAARGRTLTGLPEGGTGGGTVGVALSDLEDRAHDHAVAEATSTTAAGGAHDHAVSGGVATTSAAGAHNHRWIHMKRRPGRWRWRSWTETGTVQIMSSWGDGIGSEGGGHYPISVPSSGVFDGRSQYTEPEADHSHTVDLSDTQTGAAGQHAHDFTVAGRQTSATSATMPYLQLLACRKD